MQWSKKGARLLLQTRTRTLDGTLHDLFTSWYPAMPANDVQPAPRAAAAGTAPRFLVLSTRLSLLIARTEQPCLKSSGAAALQVLGLLLAAPGDNVDALGLGPSDLLDTVPRQKRKRVHSSFRMEYRHVPEAESQSPRKIWHSRQTERRSG